MLITALLIAAAYAYAESEATEDAVTVADTGTEAAEASVVQAVEVIDKGTQAVTEQQELLQVETSSATQ
jgi:hypothetical protein